MRRRVPRVLRCVLLSFPMLFFWNRTAFGIDCPKCKQPYPDFTRLAVHCALEHNLWLCPKCPKTFPVGDKKAYWRPRVKEHGEIVCFDCNLRVFRDKSGWERHLREHREEGVHSVSSGRFPCCLPSSLSKENTIWSQQLHRAHFHGSWLSFFVTVHVLSDCCKPFRKAILTDYSDYLKSDWTDNVREKFLKGIRTFSNHVYEKHGLCFLCERELTPGIDKDIFDNQPNIGVDVFLRSGDHVLIFPKERNFTCFCGKRAQRNAESRLFVLKFDRLPFGTGLNTVTRPFYCVVDDGKNEKKDPPERLKAENAMPTKSGESTREYSDEPKGNFLKSPPSPSLSTKSGDTTFASIDDKKLKKLPVFDTRVVVSANNKINVKQLENL